VALFDDHKPADTLVGVAALAHPGCRIEIEAIAVVDEPVFNRSAFVVH
jgi:enamine deaminase RidA (YjgF/YER057c/UK114 family)